mmetsp:Transcript_59062/g.141062  ORF Transcript_59062/g.141062 Transcript_59062/m.141062 type:complete len:222 (-) Transcript_59062:1669-2334(-)
MEGIVVVISILCHVSLRLFLEIISSVEAVLVVEEGMLSGPEAVLQISSFNYRIVGIEVSGALRPPRHPRLWRHGRSTVMEWRCRRNRIVWQRGMRSIGGFCQRMLVHVVLLHVAVGLHAMVIYGFSFPSRNHRGFDCCDLPIDDSVSDWRLSSSLCITTLSLKIDMPVPSLSAISALLTGGIARLAVLRSGTATWTCTATAATSSASSTQGANVVVASCGL